VRDEHHGFAETLPQVAQLLLHDLAGLRVESAERLVHQQDRRLAGQHARDGDGLLHATGQPVRERVLEAVELDHVDEGLRGAPAFRLGNAALGEAIFHIAEHGFPGKQGEMLEHDAAVRPRFADCGAAHADFAGRAGHEAADHVQQRALTAAARSDDGDEFALADRQRDPIDGRQFAIVAQRISLACAVDVDERHCASLGRYDHPNVKAS